MESSAYPGNNNSRYAAIINEIEAAFEGLGDFKSAEQTIIKIKRSINVPRLPADIKKRITTPISNLSKQYEVLQQRVGQLRKERGLVDEILHTLKKQMVNHIDEFDVINSCKNEVNFPLGQEESLSSVGYALITELYFGTLLDEDTHSLLIENKQTEISQSDYEKRIRPKLIANIYQQHRITLEKAGITQNQLSEYLTNSDTAQAKKIDVLLDSKLRQPEILTVAEQQEFQRLRLFQELISNMLFNAFQSSGHVHYGPSQKEDLITVIPYSANNEPKEGARFKNAWETCLKTCQYYLQKWESPQQTSELLLHLESFLLPAQQKEFLALINLSSEDLYDTLKNPKQLNEITRQIDNLRKNQNPIIRTLIGAYLRESVFPKEVRETPVQITSCPQHLVGMAHVTQGYSGTFSGQRTWNAQTYQEPGIDGKTAFTLLQNSNSKVLALGDSTAQSCFRILTDTQSLTAFIDLGPLFKGSDNEAMVQQFFAGFEQKKMNKRAIISY